MKTDYIDTPKGTMFCFLPDSYKSFYKFYDDVIYWITKEGEVDSFLLPMLGLEPICSIQNCTKEQALKMGFTDLKAFEMLMENMGLFFENPYPKDWYNAYVTVRAEERCGNWIIFFRKN